jgi:hypothetical protein
MTINFFTTEFRKKNIQGYEIKLAECRSHNDITAMVAPMKIQRYTYEFRLVRVFLDNYTQRVFKFGRSDNHQSHTPVERIYRLAGHLPGWDSTLNIPLRGPSGDDMIDICENYYKLTGHRILKDDVIIRIHDFTNIPSPSQSDPEFLIKKHERYLIKQYKETYGVLPVGNVRDEGFMDYKSTVDRAYYSQFIYEEA